jgi:hypothetical protein
MRDPSRQLESGAGWLGSDLDRVADLDPGFVSSLGPATIGEPSHGRAGIGRNVLDNLSSNDVAFVVEDALGVVAVVDGALSQTALGQIIESLFPRGKPEPRREIHPSCFRPRNRSCQRSIDQRCQHGLLKRERTSQVQHELISLRD